MITTKMKHILLLSLLLVYAHGIEEIIGGFWNHDSLLMTFNDQLTNTPVAVYFASHVVWWIMLPIAIMAVIGGKWRIYAMYLFGAVFFIELHHPVTSLITGEGYYPGMLTALLYPVLGYLYWKELLTIRRQQL